MEAPRYLLLHADDFGLSPRANAAIAGLFVRRAIGSATVMGRIKREYEYRLMLDPDVRRTIDEEGFRLLSWKELRDRQRSR
ncbi:ChbG/HpnK family deacetylase [Paenibacillus flagellatus]|uniref:Uncharacterized protein n=1 Tax=Paenibacillus flagellatus TaxID=2211139 RepID=A0A2V5KPP8_9BACL|nr:ChbG/HpnK family deacetylase [Paenibacillus flagellatus]PYI50496.1 hypothetical protein DLM86_28765 [Paenibacillus flagellatus]